MSFEDVECLKNAFRIYNVPTDSLVPPRPKTRLVLRKRNLTYTRVTIAPAVYGTKHHFKMLVYSLLSKLRLKRGMNN